MINFKNLYEDVEKQVEQEGIPLEEKTYETKIIKVQMELNEKTKKENLKIRLEIINDEKVAGKIIKLTYCITENYTHQVQQIAMANLQKLLNYFEILPTEESKTSLKMFVRFLEDNLEPQGEVFKTLKIQVKKKVSPFDPQKMINDYTPLINKTETETA